MGFDTIVGRGRLAAEGLPADLVYVGFSLGVLPAQMLAQTRPGARAALLFHACVPPARFGCDWARGVPLQIHLMEADPEAQEDLEVARRLSGSNENVELFLYPGDRHLFADSSLPDHDEGAAALLRRRVLGFLGAVG